MSAPELRQSSIKPASPVLTDSFASTHMASRGQPKTSAWSLKQPLSCEPSFKIFASSEVRSTICFRPRQYGRRMLCRRFVIADKSLRFHRLVRREIMSPAETDWLIAEFRFHVERPCRIART